MSEEYVNDVPHADWVEEKLESLPFVEWDRFTVNNFDNGVMLMNIYGWIDRPDDHEDFVLLQLYPKKPDIWGYITSSDEYTEEIYELLFDEEADDHNSCRRVEHDLDVDNCVRLTEQSSLDVMTDGGTDARSAEEVWRYDAFRVGRATRTVEIAAPDGGTQTIEEGTIRFDPINREDTWMWEEDSWVAHFFAPDGGVGFEGGVALPHDVLGILEFPELMTDEEAGEWLEEEPERWQQFRDETLECDVTAEDILNGGVQ